MTFFFLVTGLEARREVDMGQLRERRRYEERHERAWHAAVDARPEHDDGERDATHGDRVRLPMAAGCY